LFFTLASVHLWNTTFVLFFFLLGLLQFATPRKKPAY
jgi:hypothetical protein